MIKKVVALFITSLVFCGLTVLNVQASESEGIKSIYDSSSEKSGFESSGFESDGFGPNGFESDGFKSDYDEAFNSKEFQSEELIGFKPYHKGMAPILPPDNVEIIDGYYKNGDFSVRKGNIRGYAYSGNAAAQYNYGLINEALDNPKKKIEARQWYIKSALQGYARAQFKEAKWLADHLDEDESAIYSALYWYRKAAKQGHVEAQFGIGHMYSLLKSPQIGLPGYKMMAYMWISIAKLNGSTDSRKTLQKVKRTMSQEEKVEAEGLIKKCLETKYKYCGEEYR